MCLYVCLCLCLCVCFSTEHNRCDSLHKHGHWHSQRIVAGSNNPLTANNFFPPSFIPSEEQEQESTQKRASSRRRTWVQVGSGGGLSSVSPSCSSSGPASDII